MRNVLIVVLIGVATAASADPFDSASLRSGRTEGEPGSLGAARTERKPGSLSAARTEREPGSLGAARTEREPGSLGAARTEREPGSLGAARTEGPPGPAGAAVTDGQRSDPAATHEARPESLSMFGLLLDGGFPDGVGLSAVARPLRVVRADAGLSYNVLGFGLRAGATLLPLSWPWRRSSARSSATSSSPMRAAWRTRSASASRRPCSSRP